MKNSKKISKKNQDPLDRDLTHLFEKSGWKKFHFELKPKNKTITLRISEELLEAIKEKAESEGLDYQKWIRNSLEESLGKIA
jgi:predicted DNA binding CopG/RHH family protein